MKMLETTSNKIVYIPFILRFDLGRKISLFSVTDAATATIFLNLQHQSESS